MSVLSKLGAPAKLLMNCSRYGAPTTVCNIVRHGHGHVFRRRQGQMMWNKAKDYWHFYIMGIGIVPVFAILYTVHAIYGPCELTDYPTEGPPPRYWQFERTPLRQFCTRYFGVSDMMYMESNMSFLARCLVKNQWRLLEKRVKHLQSERLDYKGYYYQPITNEWLDLSKRRAHQHAKLFMQQGHAVSQDI